MLRTVNKAFRLTLHQLCRKFVLTIINCEFRKSKVHLRSFMYTMAFSIKNHTHIINTHPSSPL